MTNTGIDNDNSVVENYDAESVDVTKMLDAEDPWLARKNKENMEEVN